MSIKLDIYKEDLYAILGVSEDASVKEITKSYRKQALKCHPDKNPCNPRAAEQFHKLTLGLQILTDTAAKGAYDKSWRAGKDRDVRKNQHESKRKKFKFALDARERAAKKLKEDSAGAAKKLQAEIDRLRNEGNRILQETQEQFQKDLQNKLLTTTNDDDRDNDLGNTAKIKPTFGGPTTVDSRDYESIVLMRMRQAEERKKLIEQMMKEDDGGSK